MEDAIRFFRGEFTQAHVDPEKFDKAVGRNRNKYFDELLPHIVHHHLNNPDVAIKTGHMECCVAKIIFLLDGLYLKFEKIFFQIPRL